MLKKRNILSLLWLLCISTAHAQQLRSLRCEMRNDPEGIDVTQPRLSWEITSEQRNVQQTAYHIIVASSEEKLKKNEGDLWNSGKVASSQSIHISYNGKPLQSRASAYWKVRVWTNKGESEWSAGAHWSIGLLKAADWTAQWIGMDKAFPWDSVTQFSRLSARYYRKEFNARKQVQQAKVYVSGLGLYELYINGEKIGDEVLMPGPTDYRQSCFYNTFDVTSQVQQGKNAIAAVVGNGRFFTMRQQFKPKKINTFGYPQLLLQLEITYTDGTRQVIQSDRSWKMTADGPIRTNNEYDGEEYDATKELKGWNKTGFDDADWLQPDIVKAPAGRLKAQMNAGMKVMQTLKPRSIKALKPGTYILDMGQNMTGWLAMKVKGAKGHVVQLRFAETLQQNGELFTANLRDAKVTDRYTLKGEGVESWEPSFVYHGFRYVEIVNYPGTPTPEDFEGKIVYDDMRTTGTFETSDSTINQVYRNAWWGISGNYKGMPVDCPQRNERQPWLGDRATGARGESFLFDNSRLYAKWLDDIRESQTTEGSIPDVAPAFWNYYSDNMTWPAAYILITDMLYTQYGDKEALRKHYDAMKKWLDYMRRKYMKDYILTKDKYGDWCVPPESKELIHTKDSSRRTDGQLIATAYYYRMLYHMQQFAHILGKPDDFSALSDSIRNAFRRQYLNTAKSNTVTANLLPLYFGMVPEQQEEVVFKKITEEIRIKQHFHISTGVIGTQWLMRGLTQYDRPDIAYTLATNRDYPSWGYMAENGATTIWELWNGNTANPGMNSGNHVMLLGDLLTWYYENLAGIKSDSAAVAFKQVIMKPAIIDGLNEVKASYHSMYGLIKSEWKKSMYNFKWRVTIPVNSSAMVYVPAASQQEVTVEQEAEFIRMDGQYAVYRIGSGNYTFSVKPAWKEGIVKDEFIFSRSPDPESHAATIAETPKGLIAAWFAGTKERNPDVGIVVSRLVDDKWTEPVEVVNGVINDTLRYACWNPVLFQVPGGELLLFYKTGPNVAGWKGWLIRSKDAGITWSKPEALPEGFLGPVKNKPVMLKNGDILCASSTEGNGWKVHFEVTSDAGRTWRKIGPINDGKTIQAIQPSILTYPDGRLQVLCRTRNRAIASAWSKDMGKTWSDLELIALPNNNSGTDAVTLKDGRQLLVYNHVLPPGTETKGPRTPLNVSLSNDGLSWNAACILEDSPVSQYSYPSVIQSADGMVHIVYTWRRERIKYVKIDPAALQTLKIENANWPRK